MSMPFFQYLDPKTKADALSMRASYRAERLQVIAGGTEIIGRLKHGLCRPDYAMSLKDIEEMSGITTEGDSILIGSATTLRRITESAALSRFDAIVEASLAVAASPIQNIATLGGNILQQTRCLKYNQSELVRTGMAPCFKTGGDLCNVVDGSRRCFSVYQGDIAPSLMVFDAILQLETATSLRTIRISELFSGRGEKPFLLHDDELLTRILLEQPKGIYGSSYKKLRLRSALDYPLAAAAVFLSFTEGGEVSSARIAVSAAGPAPKRVETAESFLIDRRPNQQEIDAAAEQAAGSAQVVDNLPLSAAYRRSMVGVMVKRAITEALQDNKRVHNR